MNDEIKRILASRVESVQKAASSGPYAPLMSAAQVAYEERYKQKMPEMRQQILLNNYEQLYQRLTSSGLPKEFIKSAVENIADVTNPIAMLFQMVSVLVPNFSYMDVAAVQPMPTKDSPIFFPRLQANTARNGIAVGQQLLGGQSWEATNDFTANRERFALTIGAADATGTLTYIPLDKKIFIRLAKASGASIKIACSPASGGTAAIPSTAGWCTGGSVNMTTKAVTVTAVVANSVTSAKVDYRYDFEANGLDPVQVTFDWASTNIIAEPRRLRSVYSLDNFYAAKNVLKGYDIDAALADSVNGYMNKEISCGVYDNMLDNASSIVTWSETLPSGVSWAFHRLSLLAAIVSSANQIRKDVARSAGNTLVLGTKWMNYIETFGEDLWKPDSYSKEPIGPYTAGTLANKYKVVKNQGFGDNTGFISYKSDDTDASYAVGVFIGLYNTDPVTFDTLKVQRGAGTQIGEKLIFNKSIIELDIIP
jgi:hypothetical protein